MCDHYEKHLMNMVQKQTDDLSKAMGVRVLRITSSGQSGQWLLQDYVRGLPALEVTELSILSSERKGAASSSQARVGTRIHAPQDRTGLSSRGEKARSSPSCSRWRTPRIPGWSGRSPLGPEETP